MQRALVAGLLASVACGIIGTYVVVKRIVFISGGISHASLGGVGLAMWLGVSYLYGALVFSLAAAAIVGIASVRQREQEEILIGTVWAVGMALGGIFISMAPLSAGDPSAGLFGSVYLLTWSDVGIIFVLDAIIVATVWIFNREFLAITLDEEFAELRGLPVRRLYLILLALVALTVVAMLKVVGIILLIALLTLPPAISRWFTSRLHTMMVLSCIIGALFIFAGLLVSFQTDWPPGASIILTAAAVYGLLSLLRRTGALRGAAS